MQNKPFARCVMFLVVAFSVVTYAQSYSLPDPGLTPESPLYFLDLWDERMRLFFTHSDEARLKRYTAIVEERLAETDKLAGRGIAATQKSLEEYQAYTPLLFGVAERLDNKIILTDALRMITDHLAVLDHVSERTDYEKKRFVLTAKKFVIDQQLQTLSFFAKKNPEDALRVFGDALQRRMDRIREVAIDKENNEEALQEYAAYLSEVDPILHEWKIDRVDGVPPAVFMEITVRGHEGTLLGPVRERIPPTLDQELFLLVNKVRELSGRELLTVLPPRKAKEVEPTSQPVLPPPGGESTSTTTQIPSPQPSPVPQPPLPPTF